MVVGELALGAPAQRTRVLALPRDLPATGRASDDELLDFVEARRLASHGLSLVDAHLLAVTLLTPGLRLWTRDRRLHGVAADLAVAWEPAATSGTAVNGGRAPGDVALRCELARSPGTSAATGGRSNHA